MSEQMWDVTLSVSVITGGDNFFYHTDIKAGGVDNAKEKILAWSRKKLKRFRPKRGRVVLILAAPCVTITKGEEPRVLDGTKMLRNRFRFCTPASIQRASVRKLFVVGYGTRANKELNE